MCRSTSCVSHGTMSKETRMDDNRNRVVGAITRLDKTAASKI